MKPADSVFVALYKHKGIGCSLRYRDLECPLTGNLYVSFGSMRVSQPDRFMPVSMAPLGPKADESEFR